MILIISSERDLSTDKVIDWLIFLKGDFRRINKGAPIKNAQITLSNDYVGFDLFDNQLKIQSSEINTFWYRKNGIKFYDFHKTFLIKRKKNRNFQQFLFEEKNRVKEFIEFFFSQKKGIGYYEGLNLNKLKVLLTAKECGISIPFTTITTEKKFVPSQKSIVKNISEVLHFNRKGKRRITYTKTIDDEQLRKSFNITLFQKELEKKFEVRSFYLKGHLYSMAIFSQNDNKTKTDFRKYNFEKPNRSVPYILPLEISDKLIRLMKKLDLDTGSIDLIVTSNDEYYFLEVNPTGQFGMVSHPCNYYLEKKIAQTLINYDNEENITITKN